MSKSILIIIGIIVIAGAVVLGLRFFGGNEDIWICQNGQWVKHGNPSKPMPTYGCGNHNQESDIVVDAPQPNATITSPLEITGQARGTWYFEAVFPILLLDGNGNEVGRTQGQAQSDWMTSDFVPFKATLEFSQPTTGNGTLVLKNDNPSGMPEKSKQIEIPVKFAAAAQKTMKVEVYFNNNQLDPQISCNKVFPVNRIVPKTTATARAALGELLKGPTEQEKSQGYYKNINSGVKIQSLAIENGVAKVDFNETLEQGVGGSCKVAAIRAQITQTLKQFSSVKSVVISINGRTEDILQP